MATLEEIGKKISEKFNGIERARDRSLILHRDVIKYSGLSIRATHRGEYDEARAAIERAREILEDINRLLSDYPEIFYAGFVQDAQKEYAEANITLALILGQSPPDPDDLKVDYASWLNGLGEAVGELRRHILDLIRTTGAERGEQMLMVADEIYYLLISMDYTDAITRNLRRTTDGVRSCIEKTRGDLTSNLCQKRLSEQLSRIEEMLSCGQEKP